jgi:hypothetical protein
MPENAICNDSLASIRLEAVREESLVRKVKAFRSERPAGHFRKGLTWAGAMPNGTKKSNQPFALHDAHIVIGSKIRELVDVLAGGGPVNLQFVDARGRSDAENFARVMG